MTTGEFTPRRIPPVCGFNLLEKFAWKEGAERGRRFSEWDFDFLVAHGFRFARLPMDYRCWTTDLAGPPTDGAGAGRQIDPTVLDEIAEAVEMGKARGIHVCLNVHRAPGYCINRPEIEPFNLWTDQAARDAFAHHWGALAERFADYSADECSFDLLNEPPSYGQRGFTPTAHRQVMGQAVEAIRAVSPARLIICDGAAVGTQPADELADLGVGQSMRGYCPAEVTHYKAHWCGRPEGYVWPTPRWPMPDANDPAAPPWDAARLRRDLYDPWRAFQARGVGVHCGECGVYQFTPPEVTYAFLDDLLGIFRANGWGWALWNLRGSFGVLDNGREGAKTEPCDGHQLDRRMLEILKSHIPARG